MRSAREALAAYHIYPPPRFQLSETIDDVLPARVLGNHLVRMNWHQNMVDPPLSI